MCLSTPARSSWKRLICMHTTGGLTPGMNSQRQRHPRALDDEELFTIEGSPTATGGQLRDNPEEHEKCGKTAKSPSMTSLRNHRDVQTLSMNCNSGNIDHPVRVLHLRYFYSFLHCQTKAPVVVQQRVSQPVQELHLKNLDDFCTVCTVYMSLWSNCTTTLSKPRTRRKPAGTELHGHRDVHNGLSHRRGGQYLYPALARCWAAQAGPVLPATPRFARPRLQEQNRESSALPPTVPPAAEPGAAHAAGWGPQV